MHTAASAGRHWHARSRARKERKKRSSAGFIAGGLHRARVHRSQPWVRCRGTERSPREEKGRGCGPAAPSSTAPELTVFRVSTDGSLLAGPDGFPTGQYETGVNLQFPLPIRVRKIVHISDLHPAQWQGRTESGDYIFARYRYGRLWIGIAPDYHHTPPTTVLETGYGDLGDGYISFRSVV